jgi:hypothetical protein
MSRQGSWLLRAAVAVVLLIGGVSTAQPVGAASDTVPARTAVSGTQLGAGYRIVNSAGQVRTFGGLTQDGDLTGVRLSSPIVGVAAVPGARGYWMVAADGGVFTYGGAGFFGSAGAIRLVRPIVGMAPTPSGRGYWLVASDGGIFAYGDAAFFGSAGAIRLAKPIVGMAATPSGQGYWLVASDGGIFAYGDAQFHGSTGAIQLVRPVVGMAATPSGFGYWLVASDGGIFAYGDAQFFGSAGAVRLVQPIVGMAATRDGFGYRMVAADGGVFNYGTASFLGSAAGRLGTRVVGMASAGLVLPPGGYGYDISWPQCTSSTATSTVTPSQRKDFAIVGVTHGKTFTANQCLAAQWSWATASGAPAMVYMNVDPPAPGAATGDSGPAGACAAADALCRAYNHGFNAAGFAWSHAASEGASADLWWLDVEVASFSDPARNAWKDARGEIAQRTIAGVRDGLRNRGVNVGIYSTPYQWRYITTTGDPNAAGQGWIADIAAVWTAGAPTNDLPSYCGADKSFAGGNVVVVQGRGGSYVDPATGREYDLDHACAT